MGDSDDMEVLQLALQLLEAARAGDSATVRSLLEQGADFAAQDEEGRTPLMYAAASGDLETVRALIDGGAPWNAVDDKGVCAGDYAEAHDHAVVATYLVDTACRAELVLQIMEFNNEEKESREASNAAYLAQRLTYDASKDALVAADGHGVMMGWETPLMRLHAQVIHHPRDPEEWKRPNAEDSSMTESSEAYNLGIGDVLNVGFGMGIIDQLLQFGTVLPTFQHFAFSADEIYKTPYVRVPNYVRPRSHTIVEAHPDVYAYMLKLGWHTLPGVCYGLITQINTSNSTHDSNLS
jgi:protein arginine N-methyltransferase 2